MVSLPQPADMLHRSSIRFPGRTHFSVVLCEAMVTNVRPSRNNCPQKWSLLGIYSDGKKGEHGIRLRDNASWSLWQIHATIGLTFWLTVLSRTARNVNIASTVCATVPPSTAKTWRHHDMSWSFILFFSSVLWIKLIRSALIMSVSLHSTYLRAKFHPLSEYWSPYVCTMVHNTP